MTGVDSLLSSEQYKSPTKPTKPTKPSEPSEPSEPAKPTDTELEPSHRDKGPTRSYQTGRCPKI